MLLVSSRALKVAEPASEEPAAAEAPSSIESVRAAPARLVQRACALCGAAGPSAASTRSAATRARSGLFRIIPLSLAPDGRSDSRELPSLLPWSARSRRAEAHAKRGTPRRGQPQYLFAPEPVLQRARRAPVLQCDEPFEKTSAAWKKAEVASRLRGSERSACWIASSVLLMALGRAHGFFMSSLLHSETVWT